MRFLILGVIALTCGVVSAAPREAKKQEKRELEPITITLDDDASPSSKPSAKPTSTPSSYRTTEEAEASYQKNLESFNRGMKTFERNASTTEVQLMRAVQTVIVNNVGKMKPVMLKWREISEKVHKLKGLKPDFQTLAELEERIELYTALGTETAKVRAIFKSTSTELDDDLRNVGVPEHEISKLKDSFENEMSFLSKRFAVMDSMCDHGVAALNVLRSEWGDWNFSETSGLQFLDGFSQGNKVSYNSAVRQYMQDVDTLRQLGGFE